MFLPEVRGLLCVRGREILVGGDSGSGLGLRPWEVSSSVVSPLPSSTENPFHPNPSFGPRGTSWIPLTRRERIRHLPWTDDPDTTLKTYFTVSWIGSRSCIIRVDSDSRVEENSLNLENREKERVV